MSRNVISKKGLVYLALLGYAFSVCFGSYLRIEAVIPVGVSTALLIPVFLLMFSRVFYKFPLEQIFLLLFALVTYTFFAALFSPTGVFLAFKNSSILGAYVLVAVCVYSANFSSKYIVGFILSFTLGLLVTSSLSLLDYYNFVSLSGVNDQILITKVSGFEVEQGSGFFANRSAMAAYLSLLVPICFWMGVTSHSNRHRILYFSSVIFALIMLASSHNRSGLLAIVLSISIGAFFFGGVTSGTGLRRLVLVGILLTAIFSVLALFYPDHFSVLLAKYLFIVPDSSGNLDETDNLRFLLLKGSLMELLSNPFGHGLSKVYIPEKMPFPLDAHNVLTHIVWSAGIIGIIWLIVLAPLLARKLKIPRSSVGDDLRVLQAINIGLLSWLINNMFHNSLAIAMLWILFGMTLSLRRNLVSKVNSG